MNLKLRQHVESVPETQPVNASGAASTGAAPEASPSISGWLGVFASMLPRRQAEGVREELEGHLRERVRDLMVGGIGEGEATKRAIAELGEAAELAGKYRSLANEPRRRMAMYGMILGVAGAALALGVAANFRQPEVAQERAKQDMVSTLLAEAILRAQPEVKTPLLVEALRKVDLANVQPVVEMPSGWHFLRGVNPTVVFEEQPAVGLDFTADVKFEGTPAADVLVSVERFAKMPVQANWEQLGQVGLQRDTKVTLQAQGAGAAVILRALNEATGVVGEAPIGWRAANGVLEVGLASHFDKREVKLVIYDLEGIIEARQAKYNEERAKIVEEVVLLVSEFVYPEGWRGNGGDLAKMTVVGDRMFVHAPERFHTQIKWMLDQLPSNKEQKQGNAGGTEVRRYVVQHLMADEVLEAIKKNLAIRAIDFSKFTVDTHSNSILGRVTEEENKLVMAALGQVDIERKQAQGDVRQELILAMADRNANMVKVRDDRAAAEEILKQDGLGQAERARLQESIKLLRDVEDALRVEIEELKRRSSDIGSGRRERVFVTGLVPHPGAYVLTDRLTLRRLLVGAGGIPREAVEVVISETENGVAKVRQTLKASELQSPEGPDPEVRSGQLVSVR